MNCQDFEDVVTDLAREQMMDASVRTVALRHAQTCRSCEVRLEDERQLTMNLKQYAREMADSAPPVGFEETLRREFRLQPTRPPRKVVGRNAYAYAAAAAVAALLLIAGITFAIRSAPAELVPAPVAVVPSDQNPPQIAVTPVVQQARTVDTVRTEPPRRSIRRTKRQSQHFATAIKKVEIAPVEISTRFIPTDYSSAATVHEGGQVVRVELSRVAMARLGLPVNMERYDETVTADIWLGADGLARAIRFVQ